MLDHVVKNPSARGRFATGSQHKLAGIDGAGYVLERGQPFGKGMVGTSPLYIAKDRHGGVQAHAVAGRNRTRHIGTPRIDATEDYVCASLEPPETAEKWEPSDVMEEISRLLAAVETTMTFNAIKESVNNRVTTVRTALDRLVEGGFLSVKAALRNSQLYRHLPPYPPPSRVLPLIPTDSQ